MRNSNKEIRHCEVCNEELLVTAGQIERSRTGRFTCPVSNGKRCRYILTAESNRKSPALVCALPRCDELASRGGKYCSREHSDIGRTKQKFVLTCCVDGCEGKRTYYPSTVPATGAVFCDEHSRSQKGMKGRKPRKGTTIPCALGPDCINPTLAPESRPGTVYRSKNSKPGLYCSPQCLGLSRQTFEMKECSWKGWDGLLPVHYFKTFPCEKEAGLGKWCGVQHMAHSKIKRPRLDLPFHNNMPKKEDDKGYLMIFEPENPASAPYRGWMYEHRYVAEIKEGRPIQSLEDAHHGNDIKDDNRPENLEVLTHKEHAQVTSNRMWTKLRTAQANEKKLERLEKHLKELGVDLSTDWDENND